MPENKHKHEEGESTERCPNCIAGRLVEDLTEFELFSLVWFREKVNQFAFDANLVGGLVKELGLEKETKTVFLAAVNLIYQNDMKISEARARKEARE